MLGIAALSLLLSWVQVSSDTFVVKSSAGEERAKRVLKELEEFHQLIGTFVFRTARLPELPIEVLVIGDDPTMKELAPEYNGKKVGVAGYYQRGQERDFIVLSGRVFPNTLTKIVYHELTHYFLSRALVPNRPVWLNEGLAEYFATADIGDDEIFLGELSPERMQSLGATSLLSLKDFWAVGTTSPYYNESFKASIFYAQAWAFVHYLMHGEHAAAFRQYLDALTRDEASLLDYLKTNERTLELGFETYIKMNLPRSAPTTMKASAGGSSSMKIRSIPDSEARMSIAEIFLANGQYDRARNELEALGSDLTRASYYRGILARLTGDPSARDFFVDALLDPELAARSASQLVELGETHIPAVRAVLEEAAARGTRNPHVYLALTKIYSEDLRQTEEGIRLNRQRTALPPEAPVPATPEPAEAKPTTYANGAEQNFKYQLSALAGAGPRVQTFVAPYYPEELLVERISGEVVLDIQVTEEGKVGGIWLVSAAPEVFGNLATSAVREWRFEPVAAKIRVVLSFTPPDAPRG